jgi:hypothetical protein
MVEVDVFECWGNPRTEWWRLMFLIGNGGFLAAKMVI